MVDVDIEEVETRSGDIFLLCSDGLSGMVHDDVIQSVIDSLKGDLQGAADLLVQLALEGGGKDNISLILVRHIA